MTEPTLTSYQSLTPEQERILAFLAAYPHASVEEIAPTTSRSSASCREALLALIARGFVKRSGLRFEGWLAVGWMFDPDGDAAWPQERAAVVDMALLRRQQAIQNWKDER